jgi:hypothetical protein
VCQVNPCPRAGLKLPSDAELDKMVAFLEKVWRRLMEMGRTERKVEGRY